MTPIEAEEIIEKFHQSIKDLRPNAIVQSDTLLPYTPARIKYAHFVFAEELVSNLTITDEKIKELMESYGIIDSFFVENSELVNEKYREYLARLKEGVIIDFLIPNPFGELEPVNEFRNFIGESWFIKYHTDLFSDKPIGTAIYQALREKAIREEDIKLLKEIANTSLTRSINFPHKKTNENCVFI